MKALRPVVSWEKEVEILTNLLELHKCKMMTIYYSFDQQFIIVIGTEAPLSKVEREKMTKKKSSSAVPFWLFSLRPGPAYQPQSVHSRKDMQRVSLSFSLQPVFFFIFFVTTWSSFAFNFNLTLKPKTLATAVQLINGGKKKKNVKWPFVLLSLLAHSARSHRGFSVYWHHTGLVLICRWAGYELSNLLTYQGLSQMWTHTPTLTARSLLMQTANETRLKDHPSRLLYGLKSQILNWCILPFM